MFTGRRTAVMALSSFLHGKAVRFKIENNDNCYCSVHNHAVSYCVHGLLLSNALFTVSLMDKKSSSVWTLHTCYFWSLSTTRGRRRMNGVDLIFCMLNRLFYGSSFPTTFVVFTTKQ